jgi:hypothetical protein
VATSLPSRGPQRSTVIAAGADEFGEPDHSKVL